MSGPLDSYGVTYRAPWDCFVCAACRYGVRPSNVRAHWGKRHLFAGEQLRTIVELCRQQRARHAPGRDRPSLPAVLQEPDPALASYEDAL